MKLSAHRDRPTDVESSLPCQRAVGVGDGGAGLGEQLQTLHRGRTDREALLSYARGGSKEEGRGDIRAMGGPVAGSRPPPATQPPSSLRLQDIVA